MTNNVEPAKYQDVVETVRQWPSEARRDLLRDVLRTFHDQRSRSPTRGFSADQVIRLLQADQPAPTDEECDRILEEELMKKYAL
jgi:hypothetical protein